MKVKFVIYVGFLILLMTTAVGCGILQEPEAASEPIEAIPLELEAAVPPATEMPPTEVPPTETVAENEEPTPEPTKVPPTEEPGKGLQIYQIVPGESSVRFELDEELRGNPITVVGETDQVAGEIAVDLAELSSTQVGTIQINARALATDNDFRNRAIKNEILNTNSLPDSRVLTK